MVDSPPIPVPSTTTRPSPAVLAGISCLSAAILIVELTLTRIFSVTMFYHFAFLAVSVALFGLSASGVFVYVTPRLHPPASLLRQLKRYALLFWIVTIASMLLLLRIRVGLNYTPRNLILMIVIYLVAAVPFAAAGACLTLAVSRLHGDINRVYGADLGGAAAGCFLLIPALNFFGGPGVLLVAAGFGATASLLFAVADRARLRMWYVAPIVGTAIALAAQAGRPFLDVWDTKGHEGDTVLFSKWNSFSRIAVYDRLHGDWGLSDAYSGPRPETRFMDIDSAASTPILAAPRGGVEGMAYLRYELTGLAYAIKPRAHVLVIGPGGGRDLWTALVFGARRVDGVEINPIIAGDVMGRLFRTFSGNIYQRPGVSVVVDDGRSFVRRSKERYDLIQASLVDTWAATSAGAYTLSENNLYTVEAFVDYLRHLKPEGVLTISRWVHDGLRLVSLAAAAGKQLGWPGVSDRLFIARHGPLATFILKNSPLTDAETGTLVESTRRLRFEILYAPPSPVEPAPPRGNDYARLATAPDPAAFYRSYPLDVSPTTDDRPFFFHTTKLRDQYKVIFGRGMLFGTGLSALLSLLLLSTILVALFILLPLAWLSPEPVRRADLPLGPLVYFGCLGSGFMLVEIGLIQRFVLFLGHPVYPLTVILFTLLLGGGIGSAISRRLIRDPRHVLVVAIPTIVLAGLVYAAMLPPLFTAWMGFARPLRILLSILLLLPVGVLLGTPLPAGVRLISARQPGLLPWVWAINGATSVLGATLAIFIAMNWGFTMVAASGSAIYGVAGAVGLWISRPIAEQINSR